ncbi:MAG: vWA domain-containing protein, partial [Spirochaetota bacterium]
MNRIPSSANEALNRRYLDSLLTRASSMEPGFLQVKLLSMVQERADPHRRKKVKKMLLERIILLSRKIASNARKKTRSAVAAYRPGLDEIDVDRTLEEQLGKPYPDYRSIYCHEKLKQTTACVLMLDVSNSMHREKIAVASIATGVFASKLKNDFHGVITFDREPTVIKYPDEPNSLEKLLNRMLDIQTGGATNIRKALQCGLE